MPAIGPLNDPAPGLFSTDGTGEGGFASAANVGLDASSTGLLLRLLVVISLVEADILGPPGPTGRTHGHGIQCLADHVLVVHVGACKRNGQRYAGAVGQDVALGAEFSPIGRIGAGEVPPFGALTLALSSDVHSQSMPTLPS
jgi:hypothetical protein